MHQKEQEMGVFLLQQVLRMNLQFQFSLVTKLGVLEFLGGGFPCLTIVNLKILVYRASRNPVAEP